MPRYIAARQIQQKADHKHAVESLQGKLDALQTQSNTERAQDAKAHRDALLTEKNTRAAEVLFQCVCFYVSAICGIMCECINVSMCLCVWVWGDLCTCWVESRVRARRSHHASVQ